MARSRDRRAPRPAILIPFAVLAACVTSTERSGPSRVLTGNASGTVVTRNPDGSVTRDASLQVSLEPLPALETDGFHAPLLSDADGGWLVWQARSNADWPMLLAQRGASTAVSASVALRRPEGGETASRGDDLLLGRMATARGVLVEGPRPDGSRRVGLLPWRSETPQWLEGEGEVRAFACLGPREVWAYARRGIEAEAFDLVVERPEGRLEFPRREGESWMMPVVAPDGVYGCSLRDGILELAFLPIRSGEHLTRTQAEPAILRQRISIRATARTAYQTMAAVPPDAASLTEGLLFFHPEMRRMAVWSPRSGRVALLAEGSVAARQHAPGTMLVTLPRSLVLQEWPPEPAMAPLQVLPGLWIPCGNLAGATLVAAPRDNGCGLSRLGLGLDTKTDR
ncbi:MAG: hypothetical protein EBQ99_10460 [Planctomycetes bacterium]|nr:hypothetical protein [Planctomycetota bacterium]